MSTRIFLSINHFVMRSSMQTRSHSALKTSKISISKLLWSLTFSSTTMIRLPRLIRSLFLYSTKLELLGGHSKCVQGTVAILTASHRIAISIGNCLRFASKSIRKTAPGISTIPGILSDVLATQKRLESTTKLKSSTEKT